MRRFGSKRAFDRPVAFLATQLRVWSWPR